MSNKEKGTSPDPDQKAIAWGKLNPKNWGREKMTDKEYQELRDAIAVMRRVAGKMNEDEFGRLIDKVDGKDGVVAPTMAADEFDEFANAVKIVEANGHKYGAKAVNKVASNSGNTQKKPNNTKQKQPTPPTGGNKNNTQKTQKAGKTQNPFNQRRPIAPPPAMNHHPAPTQPKGDMPLPNKSQDIDESVPLPDFDALTVGVVNQDEDLNAKARYVGESRLAEDLNKGGFFRKAAKRVWKGGIAKNYYRQKYINEARHDMREAQNIVLDFDEKERRRFNNDICKSFLSKEEGVIDESKGDERKSLLAENPELHHKIQDVVARYASGSIKTPEEASREFKKVIKDLDGGKYFGDGKHIAISNITEVAIEAKNRYDSLMTVAESMNGKLEHDKAIARVMAGFDVMYGQRRLDRLDPHYNKVDKVVDKIQHSKIGAVVSPETIALATGAAACVVSAVGKRLPSVMFAAIPGLSGAITSGMRASSDFEKDRARALYDVRYSRQFEGSQKRRQEMMKTMHEHHNAVEVRDNLAGMIQALNEAKSSGRDTTRLQNDLLRAVAQTKTFLNYDKTGNSVLSYTSEVDAPSEQLSLLEQVGRAKQCLRENGVANLDARLANQSELMTNFVDRVESNLKETAKVKRRVKTARILKRAGFSLAVGAAAGVAMQEVRALCDPNTQGIFEKGAGDYGTRLTAGKKLALKITGKDRTIADTKAGFNINGHGVLDNSKDISFVKAQDGTYSMVGPDGKSIADGLDWNSKTGQLTPESYNILKQHGIDVTKSGSLTQKFEKTITSMRTKNVSYDEYVKSGQGNTPSVIRKFWYDNNTSVYDKNELRCYYTTDASGNHGLVTGMLDDGSYHGGTSATFSGLAAAGKIKMLISPTEETQGTPIEVIGERLSNGQMSFCPEPGTPAAQFFDENGIFVGRYAEIVQDLGSNDAGQKLFAPLATLVGEGKSGGDFSVIEEFNEKVTESFSVPEYMFRFPTHEWDFPMILPFSAGGAMNASEHNTPNQRTFVPGERIDMPYGYGYGYQGTDKLGVVSPDIAAGQKLELGKEVSWYVDDQMRSKGGVKYFNEVKKQVESSNELKKLDNNVKTIVTIPVHGPTETDNIYRTLSLYAKQKDIDPKSMVILLDVNWSKKDGGANSKYTPAEVAANTQATLDRINQARKDFPNLQIATMEQTGHDGIHDVAREMNDVAMYAINSAIKDGRMSADNDVLIIRNDADVKNMNERYIASYQQAMKENPKTPLFTGSSWFDISRQNRAPGFAASLMIERINALFRTASDGVVFTEGRNFAYRATHFAASNGYGYAQDGAVGWTGAGSDDVRIGYRIEEAFGQAYANRVDGSTQVGNNELMDPMTRMMVHVGGGTISSDDNRQLQLYEAGLNHRGDYVSSQAYGSGWGGYNQKVLRPDAIKDFVEDLTDRQRFNDVAEQFEREVSYYFSWGGDPHSPRWRKILCWLFNTDDAGLDKIAKIDYNPNGGDPQVVFRFVGDGKEKYREMLVSRFGDGFTPEVRNTLQKAVAENKWMSPNPNPSNNQGNQGNNQGNNQNGNQGNPGNNQPNNQNGNQGNGPQNQPNNQNNNQNGNPGNNQPNNRPNNQPNNQNGNQGNQGNNQPNNQPNNQNGNQPNNQPII